MLQVLFGTETVTHASRGAGEDDGSRLECGALGEEGHDLWNGEDEIAGEKFSQ